MLQDVALPPLLIAHLDSRLSRSLPLLSLPPRIDDLFLSLPVLNRRNYWKNDPFLLRTDEAEGDLVSRSLCYFVCYSSLISSRDEFLFPE